MKLIQDVAASLGLSTRQYEPMGWYKAKLALDLNDELNSRPMGKYIGVTAVSPTPLGEGKTVVAIGLAMALCRLGNRTIATLREPSLGPVFGVKGGGTGGGKSRILPSDDINLHFTGDIHAVTSANNLLAAMVDNHVKRQLTPLITTEGIAVRRAIDMNDKALGHVRVGLDQGLSGPERVTGFDLTAASEVMAILAIATNLSDLHQRLDAMWVGESPDGRPISAKDIGASGAMAALLNEAFRPNLVQTCEETPALVHAGPFANISTGNSSLIADLVALKLADYVVTESGFGADCGAEKFFNLKARMGGLAPAAQVLVCTARALKWQSGRYGTKPSTAVIPELAASNPAALEAGLPNLLAHLDILKGFGIPVVVALNRFPDDDRDETKRILDFALANGAQAAVTTDAFLRGGAGSIELAEAVLEATHSPSSFSPTYTLELSLEEKLRRIATSIYGAKEIDIAPGAKIKLAQLERFGLGSSPVCVAKTQYSLSHDPTRLGRPRNFVFPIREVRGYSGAGFVTALSGDIVTLPGLPRQPSALKISVSPKGEISGLH